MSNQNLLEDECLELFRRQYFQLLPPEQIVFPPDNILKEPAFQVALMGKVFGNESHVYHPSNRYRLRILKAIIGKIEASFQDPDEDVRVPCWSDLGFVFLPKVLLFSDARSTSNSPCALCFVGNLR